ncbi:SRPBCC domain-containing protein [Microbacterium jejuense]|uniref:SRPBCC domain-containing protein n=1 Tax=Microbacterium jejuense TaxID=1263637 RepID=A0ABS7HR05_9MICO|nr:SRPBCC domain-containing protein [Microbacterium jejuense]MBW9094464.1 SRPBCC domain-containing protein [Microbacterium jejuense]
MTDITGTVAKIDGQANLVILRRFAATADEVWRELTESARLERWIGRWEGDPRTGHVTFFMTAEGDDAPPAEYTIHECDAPRRFAGDTAPDAGGWHLWFELAEDSPGDTVLTFGQRLDAGDDVGSIGPGWEYYLDRLVAAHAGVDVATVAWDDYFPALQPAYERLVAAD